MTIHDPHHVAQLAAMLLSSHGEPERHHIKKAVDAAHIVLDEAILRAQADEANAKAAEEAAAAVAPADADKTDTDKS